MHNAYDAAHVAEQAFSCANLRCSVLHVHANGFIPQAGAFAHTFSLAQHGVCGNRKPDTAAIYSGADAVHVAAAPFLRAPERGGFLELFL